MSGETCSMEDLHTNENAKENDTKQVANSIYDEPKKTPKLIRVLTVIGYILAVSMAAIMLSLYYVLMWNPPNVTASATGNKPNTTYGKRI